MNLLPTVVSWIVGVFLIFLFVLVFYRLLTGRINTSGLLYGQKADGTRYFSPERVQLLIFTVWVGLFYLLDTYETRVLHPTEETKHTLPEVSRSTLMLLGASHGIYIAGKIYSMLISKLKGV